MQLQLIYGYMSHYTTIGQDVRIVTVQTTFNCNAVMQLSSSNLYLTQVIDNKLISITENIDNARFVEFIFDIS